MGAVTLKPSWVTGGTKGASVTITEARLSVWEKQYPSYRTAEGEKEPFGDGLDLETLLLLLSRFSV